ncbi:hypothetical protein [Desulfurobacterium crinifex]
MVVVQSGVKCYADVVVCDLENGEVLLLSLLGLKSQVDVLSAKAITRKAITVITPEGNVFEDFQFSYVSTVKGAQTTLPAGLAHAVVKSLDDYIVVPTGAESLAKKILAMRAKERLPFLLEWKDWLWDYMLEERYLRKIYSYGCLAFRFSFPENFREIVCEAVKTKELQ